MWSQGQSPFCFDSAGRQSGATADGRSLKGAWGFDLHATGLSILRSTQRTNWAAGPATSPALSAANFVRASWLGHHEGGRQGTSATVLMCARGRGSLPGEVQPPRAPASCRPGHRRTCFVACQRSGSLSCEAEQESVLLLGVIDAPCSPSWRQPPVAPFEPPPTGPWMRPRQLQPWRRSSSASQQKAQLLMAKRICPAVLAGVPHALGHGFVPGAGRTLIQPPIATNRWPRSW